MSRTNPSISPNILISKFSATTPTIELDIPSVEDRVESSTDIWARDLRALFEHAKERFGDVCWENEDDFMGLGERVWGHKGG